MPFRFSFCPAGFFSQKCLRNEIHLQKHLYYALWLFLFWHTPIGKIYYTKVEKFLTPGEDAAHRSTSYHNFTIRTRK